MKMDNCYNGRIPRELLHSQDERLTNKHIQTLTFLQDIAKENKLLKERVEELEAERQKCKELHLLAEEGQAAIKEIQKQCLKQTDEVRKILTEKHRMEMMQILEEKADMEKTLKESILKFQHEIESLQHTNVELRQEKSYESHEQMERISELESNLKDANVEIKNLRDLKDQLEGETIKQKKIQLSDMCQIQHLQNTNFLLKENLQEINQKNGELVYKLENLQREAQNDWAEMEKTKLVEKLRKKMENLVKEKELALLKVSEVNREREEVRASTEVVRMHMEKLEKEKAEVEQLCKQLMAEVELLRKKLQQEEERPSFTEFISMKREIIAVRNENESLRQKVQTPPCALPVLKEDLRSLKQAGSLTKKEKKKLLAIAFDQRSENANSD